jgi:NADPH:quinone reductase-like Zn-dependent oxidoreductase
MKAFVSHKYGSPDVLKLTEVEKPILNDDEVLIKVHAASVNAADWHLLTADIFLVRFMEGLLKPKRSIPGADVAGKVEAVGKNVRRFRPGDEVFGDILSHGSGSFAEYASAKEDALALKPANLSFEEAAAAPLAAVTALQAVRDAAQVKPGQKVLVQGASGGVGTYTVQLAKYYGAEVTAVCSTKSADMVRSIGADHVIDYTREDFTKNSQRYDVIIAVNGYHPLSAYKRALTPTGTYVMAGGTAAQIFQSLLFGALMSEREGRKLKGLAAEAKQKDLLFIKELLEAGKIKPVIDKRYPFSETPEAMRHLGTGHAKGKVVISMQAG